MRLFVPLMALVAAYLLWVGAYAPGGAFQAGAVLAASLILIILSGTAVNQMWLGWPLRLMLSFGLAAFIAIGLAMTVIGNRFMQYPVGSAGELILVIELAAAVSIGVTLAALFLGGRPWSRKRP